MTRYIDYTQIEELTTLWYEYQAIVNPETNKLQQLNYLLEVIKRKNNLAIGLYSNNQLVGFTLGYEVSEGIFYWEGIYIKPSYRYNIHKLIFSSEESIKSLGYRFWITEANTKYGYRLLSKIAKVLTIKTFIKEL